MTDRSRMTRRLFLLSGLAAAAACAAPGLQTMNTALHDSQAAAADPGVRQVAAANTGFGLRLLQQLAAASPDQNVFCSPFSVSDALTLVRIGAGGATAQDIARSLGVDGLTRDQINHAYGLLLPTLTNPGPKVELSVANALWADTNIRFAPDFARQCRQFYDARATTLALAAPDAADTINGWVSRNTRGKITQLVSPRDLRQAKAVLTNAVYFHGLWQMPFDEAATQPARFTLTNGGTRQVPLMSRTGTYPYRETPQMQAVSLPYGDGRISLDVLLPKPGTGLDALLDTLSAQAWDGEIGQLKPTRLTLFLPRFKADFRATLNPALIALGMASAFGPGADFGPTGLKGSFLSAVIHQAVVEVDEEGTVAAAATGAIVSRAMIARPIPVMRVDRPFFCAIWDSATGTLLFAGVIRNPQP